MEHQQQDDSRSYYEILQVSSTASLLEIKRAYRSLALKFHPDRVKNVQDKERATREFQAIGQAYQVLSDPSQRSLYDAELAASSLRRGGQQQTAASASQPPTRQQPQHSHHPSTSPGYAPYSSSLYRSRNFVDPFAQFDHLFRNDAFFQEAFGDMEEEFAQRFRQGGDHKNNNNNNLERSSAARTSGHASNEGWIPWLLRQCGVQFTMTTVTKSGNGSVTATSYSTNGRGAGGGRAQSSLSNGNRGGYTQKKSQTYQNERGQKVTVQSMEQNGNLLEHVYVDDQLVEQRVNGIRQPQQQQQHGRMTNSASLRH